MKKLFFFAIVALGMTAACQKPDAPVDETNEPVAIQFGMNAPTISVTKTKAAVEEWTANTGNIHVVGYNYHTNELLWVETGQPEVTGATATIGFATPLYYLGTIAYDFRAYYLGVDKPAGITDDALSLNIPVEISGEEDVMAGVTNRTTDAANATSTVQPHQLYSAFAARRDVHPSLSFSHMLTRINVTVQYPDDRADEQNLQVALQNLTVKSNTTGTLALAGNTPSITLDGGEKQLPINISGSNYGEIMIQPNLTEITFTYDLIATALQQTGQTITLKASSIDGEDKTAFQAGKEYNVTIKVYDLEEIVVSATVSEWGEGGNVLYDPDNENWTPDGYTPAGN